MAAVGTRCQGDGPSSVSQSFSFILAQRFILVPSNNTLAPEGGLAPSEGGVRVTCCKSKFSDALAALKWPSAMVPVQPSPVNATVPPDASPCRIATGLSLATSNL